MTETRELAQFLITHRDEITSLEKAKLGSLVEEWRKILLKQRMLVDLLDKRILFVGDIHGDYIQMLRAFQLFDNKNVDYIVFNGDIIDRGPEMMECIIHLLCRQLLDPENIIFLRGNHELKSVNEVYGFRGYCTGLYGSETYHKFGKAFQQLPLAAKIGNWGFITHGGVPNEQIFFHLMRLELKDPEPKSGPYSQLLWNDPDPKIQYFEQSMRGLNAFRFGKVAFEEFMEFHQLEYFFRSHQAFPEGYRWFFDKKLLTIFSSNAGPYSNVTPHYAILDKKNIEIIRSQDIEFQE